MIECVDIGTAIVAYIEPHAGAERAFNRWYERDHFYAATMAGPGAFAGARWVATHECKQVRPATGTLFGDPNHGSYLATYWLLPDTQTEWDAWVARQMPALTAHDRLFPGRDHLHTAVYKYEAQVRSTDGPHAALALDRCFTGVVMIAVDRDTDVESFMRELVGDEVPVAAAFTQERLIVSVLDEPVSDPRRHLLVLAFLDGDVLRIWRDRVEPALDGVCVRYASPFLRTIPGSDAYVDEL